MTTARGDPRARRHRLHLPRGHPDPDRARWARPKRGVGRLALETGAAVLPGRRARHRARPPRLADPPAQGEAARRQADDLPPHRAPLARARRDRHRPDLAEHRAAVGVARRPAAAAQGGRDRRRQLGHRGRRAARPRRARGPARHPHRASRPSEIARKRENEQLPARRPASRAASTVKKSARDRARRAAT